MEIRLTVFPARRSETISMNVIAFAGGKWEEAAKRMEARGYRVVRRHELTAPPCGDISEFRAWALGSE
jgi:hypothetical protein